MKPLTGSRIAVTRAAYQAEELALPLEEAGATVYRCPLIRIEPYAVDDRMRSVLQTLGDFDWLIFTSVNGVEQTMRCLAAVNADAGGLSGKRIACVGPATAAAAAMLPVPFKLPRSSLLSVEALATTRSPSGAMICA